VTRYLTIPQILFIHARLIEETGGAHDLRDLGALEAASARPQATFADQEMYPDLFSKAAALLDSLVNNHPFVDGNKRTGIAAAALFLRQNGYRLTATNPELEAFTLAVATQRQDIAKLTAWLQTHCAPSKD
jgi:death-on-curing protein